jgi:carboxyl-terminal processing protease
LRSIAGPGTQTGGASEPGPRSRLTKVEGTLQLGQLENGMSNRGRPLRERTIWIVVTAVLATVVVLLTFTPRILAGGEEAETERLLSKFSEVFRFVQDNYVDADKVHSRDLFEGAMRGLFEALGDPNSAYMSADEMYEWDDTTTGRFGGVGLVISKVDRGVEVVSPIDGTPAYRAGIHAGDLIVAVNGASVVDTELDDVLSLLRGDPGTSVTMTVLRGRSLRFDVEVVRDMIEVPTVKKAMISGGIGYLRISNWTLLTPDRVRDAVRYFDANGYRALIVDVRGNPGGLLSSVLEVADFFLSKGQIVSTRSRIPSENQVYYASARSTLVQDGLPMVALIDRGSASASEILAGALQDSGRATIMGETSYGKGSVQQIRRVDSGAFRLTMSRFYTPLGKTIDKVGIHPDVEVQEPQLDEQEEAAMSRLIDEGLVSQFVAANPQPTEQQVQGFIDELSAKGIALPERYVRRLIHVEQNRTNDEPPVYDLEYDTVLQRAVSLLQK